ncbi:hypothetical protein B0H17DRAFT_1141570 [Mycena rosella]|uniref:Uncharacterized protein n=1 Tax=Mycena rosella TaxID=1033263 RepID=A0AAD7G634_MYCRO|nr:hypothetical protein B0H17DRAFT_1141570 [Mycena rosella]
MDKKSEPKYIMFVVTSLSCALYVAIHIFVSQQYLLSLPESHKSDHVIVTLKKVPVEPITIEQNCDPSAAQNGLCNHLWIAPSLFANMPGFFDSEQLAEHSVSPNIFFIETQTQSSLLSFHHCILTWCWVGSYKSQRLLVNVLTVYANTINHSMLGL